MDVEMSEKGGGVGEKRRFEESKSREERRRGERRVTEKAVLLGFTQHMASSFGAPS